MQVLGTMSAAVTVSDPLLELLSFILILQESLTQSHIFQSWSWLCQGELGRACPTFQERPGKEQGPQNWWIREDTWAQHRRGTETASQTTEATQGSKTGGQEGN